MNTLIWTANLLGWPLIHFAIGGIALQLPVSLFSCDSWLTRERSWERGGTVYRDLLAVQMWKRHLPDGASWMGGMSKRRLKSRAATSLRSFLVETRRSEVAHWCMVLCTPVFFLWNPPWACLVMACYGITANVPCIVAQRANRIQIARMLRRTDERICARA